ncbi:MAG: hypothetical protein HY308_00980 [Gammaproteobacteria bacterium]|nr:hypothetical protein [Gammaproteobacteria bacterium]
MNIRFGTQVFRDVKIPVLWGKRAIIGHPSGELSVVDLSESIARPEIVTNKPWTNIEFSDKEDGLVIFKNGAPVLFYSPPRKLFRDLSGSLPECEISSQEIRIGTNRIQNAMVSGFQVGIGISEDGFFIGGPLPAGLATLAF